MKLSDWLRHAAERLEAVGVDSAKLEASVLAAHVLGVDRSWLYAHPEHDFNDLAGEQVLQRRERREPLAYILGRREFYGRSFEVSPAVLIPRQETEILVEAALRHAPSGARVLDVGTGSGCIAVTLKLERPDLQMTALDVSPDALDVASRNAERLRAEVEFVLSDHFSSLAKLKYDLIVTNPPYIGMAEPLMPEVVDYEPALALFGGKDGDEFLRLLAEAALLYLREGGGLLTEVGYQQMTRAVAIFEARGWACEERIRDLGGIERVAFLRKSTQ